MQYLIDVRVDGHKKSTFRINAKTESEALQRLPLRLSPKQRETYIVDAIKIDPSSIGNEEPYGIFTGE